MNQNQIKAKLFALYYGQEVVSYPTWDNKLMKPEWYIRSSVLGEIHLDGYYLLLRGIESLTDDEATTLAYLAQYHPSIEDYCKDDVWIGEGDNYPDGGFALEMGCRCWEGKLRIEPDFHIWLESEDEEMYKEFVYNTLAIHDYLRSIGIALPMTYIDENNQPVTMSVDEQVQKGWIKIKNEK